MMRDGGNETSGGMGDRRMQMGERMQKIAGGRYEYRYEYFTVKILVGDDHFGPQGI